MHDRTKPHPMPDAMPPARPRATAARGGWRWILFLVVVSLAASACVSGPAQRIVDAEPVAERELALPAGAPALPSPPRGQARLAEGVFRVHLSNLRCVRAPCPNGYMVSNVDGRPPALRPGAPQPGARLPEQIRFDAASGGAVEDGLVEQAHIGDGIVVQGRAWLIDGGRTLRVEVERLLSD